MNRKHRGNIADTSLWQMIAMDITWKPLRLRPDEKRSELPASAFAFPAERKAPLTDAEHVRNAIGRFSQIDGVTNDERAQAFGNIKTAAEYYGIDMHAKSWQDLIHK